jgi:hypothetical protein
LVTKIRLRKLHGNLLYELVKKEGWRFYIYREWYMDEIPREMQAFCVLKKIPFYFSIEERILHTGKAGTDRVIHLTLLKWHAKELLDLLENRTASEKNVIPVYVMDRWETEKIGEIKPGRTHAPVMESKAYVDIEEEVKRVVSGEIEKTGFILHGRPGNGKTSLIRYFSIKYQLPVYLVSFEDDTSNIGLLQMFSRPSGPCIVLFEDFDNYFHNRQCQRKELKFTFDTLLNIFDGIYTPATGVVYAMTANDVTKIDPAMRERPSRFKFVREIPNPPESVRKGLFNEKDGASGLAALTRGMNLDKLLVFKSCIDRKMALPEQILKDIKAGGLGVNPLQPAYLNNMPLE